MSSTTYSTPQAAQLTGGQAVVDALLRHGISTGFGIPSIHNIGIYDALRQSAEFHHWIVRHEQAGGFAADAYFRRCGRPAALFASTGPGNLFTLVPLLESLQTGVPVVLIGTNVAMQLLDKDCAALHETPQQIEILRPLTRFAARVASPDEIPEVIAAAAQAGGPAFVEIPQDLLYAPLKGSVPNSSSTSASARKPKPDSSSEEIAAAAALVEQARKPVVLIGPAMDVDSVSAAVRHLAEALQAPVLTTTTGKGMIAGDHPLSMGCISQTGLAQQLLGESDLLISFAARFGEFDTGRFSLKPPARHVHVSAAQSYGGSLFPASNRLTGDMAVMARAWAGGIQRRQPWWDVAQAREREKQRLEALHQEGYAALSLLRDLLGREDVIANDQSILNYWMSAFFPVHEPRSFFYPLGSGTLGYGLPAAVGAACANQRHGLPGRVICVAGDGGFQYTSHELATLAQYGLPVKILLVNDGAYGIIGFLQRSMFGRTHEVQLRNPDFCRLAESFGIPAQRAASLDDLRRQMPGWLESPGPALLEWQTDLKNPWETGAIARPACVTPPAQASEQKTREK